MNYLFMKKISLLFLLGVALSGCAESSKPLSVNTEMFPPEQLRKVHIIVYRPYISSPYAGRTVMVKINDMNVCGLNLGDAVVKDIDPGVVVISAALWEASGGGARSFNVDHEKIYYFRLLANGAGVFLIDDVDYVSASPELANIRAIDCR